MADPAFDVEQRHEQDLEALIPRVVPILGVLIVLFAAWDWMVDAEHARLSLWIRASAVSIAAIAYWPTSIRWRPFHRACHIYWAHSAGIIVATALLDGGLVLGLVGCVIAIVPAAITTLRGRRFALLVLPPYVLLVVCAFLRTSGIAFVNVVGMYGAGIGIAYVQMYMFRYMRLRSLSLEQQLSDLATHDPLTSCLNRARLAELGPREIAVCRRRRRPLAVALLDIDHFKRINDSFGHDIGDQALKAMADECRRLLRESDSLARLGGEEFVCLLPDTGPEEAMACAERLRAGIQGLVVATTRGPVHFTVSIGVAALRPEHPGWEALLKDADDAMYLAKQQGRNRVVVHPGNADANKERASS